MKLSLHTTFPDELKAAWNSLLAESASHVPFLRYEYLTDWWSTRGGGEWDEAELFIVTAHERDRLIGVAPLFFTTQTEVPALLLVGAIEISDYLDIIVLPDRLDEFLKLLLPYLKDLPVAWKQLIFHNLLDDSRTLPALQKEADKLGWEFTSEALQRCPYIALPDSWEEYLAGVDKKQRHEIRRKLRRIEELEIPVQLHIVEDESTLDADTDTFFSLMSQDEAKAHFLTGAMRLQMRQTIRSAFQCGCLNLAFLVIGDEKAAAYLSFDYLNRLWVYNSGLNTKFYEYSPGWVLLSHVLQWAIANQRKTVDFMRGDETYKYRFGARDRHVVQATLMRL